MRILILIVTCLSVTTALTSTNSSSTKKTTTTTTSTIGSTTSPTKIIASNRTLKLDDKKTITKDGRGKRTLSGFESYGYNPSVKPLSSSTFQRRISTGFYPETQYNYAQSSSVIDHRPLSPRIHVNRIGGYFNNHQQTSSYEPLASDNTNSILNHPYYHHQPQYIEAPEPIIEIIIKESNESLPEQHPPPVLLQPKKKKEQVQVFYVKYKKDDHHGLIIDKPVPALSPVNYHQEQESSEEYEPPQHHHHHHVTPPPPHRSTTLRTIIRPDSEVFHSDSGIHVTFGSENKQHLVDHHRKEESALQPVLALPRTNTQFSGQQQTQSFNPTNFYQSKQFTSSFNQQHQQQQQQQSRPQFNEFQSQHLSGPSPSSSNFNLNGPSPSPSNFNLNGPPSSPPSNFNLNGPPSSPPSNFNLNGPPSSPPTNFNLNGPPSSPPSNFNLNGPPSSPPSLNSFTTNNFPPPPPAEHPQLPINSRPPTFKSSPSQPPPGYFSDQANRQFQSTNTQQTQFQSQRLQPIQQAPQQHQHQLLPSAQPTQSQRQHIRFPAPQHGSPPPQPPPTQQQQQHQQQQSFHGQSGNYQQLPHQQQQQQFRPIPIPLHNTNQQPVARPSAPIPPPQHNPQPQFHQHQSFNSYPQFEKPQFNQQQQSQPQPQQPQQPSAPLHPYREKPSNGDGFNNHNFVSHQSHHHNNHQQSFKQQHQHQHQQPQPHQHQHQQSQPHQQPQQPQQHQQHQQHHHQQQNQQNQFIHQQNQFNHQQNLGSSQQIGGLIQQAAPNLGPGSGAQQQYSLIPDQPGQGGIHDLLPGGELIKSVSKYEQHITENVPFSQFRQQEESKVNTITNTLPSLFSTMGQKPNNIQSDSGKPVNIGHLSTSVQFADDSNQYSDINRPIINDDYQQQIQNQFNPFRQEQTVHYPPQVSQQQQQQQQQLDNHQQQLDNHQRQEEYRNVQRIPSQQTQFSKSVAPIRKVPKQGQSVSTIYSEVFPDLEKQQKNYFNKEIKIDGRNNFDTKKYYADISATQRTEIIYGQQPTTQKSINYSTTRNSITPTPSPAPIQKKKPLNIELPDEVPDELRQQLLSSGILDNADISVLDYDKVGGIGLENLPAEHLANFYGAGGGSQISSSNKIVTVVKPNGEKVSVKYDFDNDDDNIKIIKDQQQKQTLSKKQNVDLKVVRFDSNSQKTISDQYIKQDSTVLPTVDINDTQYNRYLPLKINGAQFPIPDLDELKGKKISSVVVLAPVDNLKTFNMDKDGRYERDVLDSKQIKFIAGDTLKQLIKKPSQDNYKKWLEREAKTDVDMQSVVLLVTKSDEDKEQEIYMYDITTKTVNKLNGELSSAFVDVAEENAQTQDIDKASITDSGIVQQMPNDDDDDDDDDNVHNNDDDNENTTDVSIETTTIDKDDDKFKQSTSRKHGDRVLISTGYSVIKTR